MVRFLSIYALASVLLRAATLVLEALIIGGVAFRLAVIRKEQLPALIHSVNKLVVVACSALLITLSLLLTLDSAVLMSTANLPLRSVLGANFSVATVTALLACLAIMMLIRRSESWSRAMVLLLCAVLAASAVATSHAASRIELRWLLASLTAVHMLASFVWIGGLPYLLLGLARAENEEQGRLLTRRFSRLAMVSVSCLALSGVSMASLYIDSPKAIYGTAYGVMVAAKVVLLAALLLLGRLNYGLVRSFRSGTIAQRLGRFAEVEVGIGITVILAAASLTSQPPAIDLKTNRVSAHEIYARMRPSWPRLRTPRHEELSPSTREKAKQSASLASFTPGTTATHPNTPGDIAWSEYNHNWLGLVLLLMGLLAVLAHFSSARWLRHWPLLLLVLSFFILLRADPEAWPLGPDGFWESFDNPEVVVHRIAAALVAAFAVFEWRVQRNRSHSRFAQYVFPAVCALGGAMLLTHSHALGNIKEDLLAELSHVPLALLGVIAGWSRWLELRLAPQEQRIPAMIWPVCFVLIGCLLLDYREA